MLFAAINCRGQVRPYPGVNLGSIDEYEKRNQCDSCLLITRAILNDTDLKDGWRERWLLSRTSCFADSIRFDSSMATYHEILNLVERSNTYSVKEIAALRIAELYVKKGNYDSALKYLDLGVSHYPDWSGEGGTLESFFRHISILYSQLYIKQGNFQQAEKSLLKYILHFPKNEDDMWQNECVDSLRILLSKHGNKKELKRQLKLAVKNIRKGSHCFYWVKCDEYFNPHINFLGQDICVGYYHYPISGESDYNEEKVKKTIRNSTFYKMVMSL